MLTLRSAVRHVLSFRSNVVMRWEWVPGSTLFLVWQQNRRTSEAFRQSLRLQELWRTTSAAGDNFFSVKVSYWLPVSLGGSGGSSVRLPGARNGESERGRS